MDDYRERYDALSRLHTKTLNHLEESRDHASLLRGAARDFLEAYCIHDDITHEQLRCELADIPQPPHWPERHTAACQRLAAAETALRAAIGHGEATPAALSGVKPHISKTGTLLNKHTTKRPHEQAIG